MLHISSNAQIDQTRLTQSQFSSDTMASQSQSIFFQRYFSINLILIVELQIAVAGVVCCYIMVSCAFVRAYSLNRHFIDGINKYFIDATFRKMQYLALA